MLDTRFINRVVLALTLCGITAGLAAHFLGKSELAGHAWAAATVIALIPLTFVVARALLSGKLGVDMSQLPAARLMGPAAMQIKSALEEQEKVAKAAAS